MDFLEHLHRLFAYDDWANREVLCAIRAAEPSPARSLSLLAHILAAEELWLGRLLADRNPVEVWPAANAEQCEARISRLSASWSGYLDALSAKKLSARTAYVNSKGEPWESAVEDVLLHVVMHSAYHRGQIASDLRAAGHTPAYTDFIHGVKAGTGRVGACGALAAGPVTVGEVHFPSVAGDVDALHAMLTRGREGFQALVAEAVGFEAMDVRP